MSQTLEPVVVATTPSPPPTTTNGVYVVIHISTTADDQGLYITKDSSEIIEMAWSLLDSVNLNEIAKNSILIKPINTPITPLCTSLTGISWDQVKTASTLKEAIEKLSQDIETHAIKLNLPFNFVTFNAWDLRMKLPKESREKSISLPKYLEYSRYFDVKREFAKYQDYLSTESTSSPSTPGAPAVNLNTPVLSSTQVAAYLNSLSSDEGETIDNLLLPRRAENEVEILSKIFSQLKQRSQSIPAILKKPHDMNLDFLQFINEKSRILYMTNLPLDTTQSELESWFTQYGGRPIAFWTIKTPHVNNNNGNNLEGNSSRSNSQASIVSLPQIPTSASANLITGDSAIASPTTVSSQLNSVNAATSNSSSPSPSITPSSPAGNSQSSRPNNSGFVIFSTHEEAIDSLAMNGRILNEKIVEVQPSSVRVLDKAQDILTPFPQSKNRPRPGDWTCPSCGFSNFQRRTACFRCSFPAASAVAIQESMYSGSGNSSSGNNNNNNSNSNNNSNGNGGNNGSGNNNTYYNGQFSQNGNINGSSNMDGNYNHHNNHKGSNMYHNMNMNNGNKNNNHYINNNNNNNNNNNQMNNYNHYNNNNNSNSNLNNSNVNHYNNRSYSQPSQMSNNSSLSNSNSNGNNNLNSNNNGNNNSNIPFRAGDWKCINENCSYHNFAKNVCCLKCGAPRVQSAIINGHAHNQHNQHQQQQQGSSSGQLSKSNGQQQGMNNSYSAMSSPGFTPQSNRNNSNGGNNNNNNNNGGNNNKQRQQLYRQQQQQQSQNRLNQQQYTPVELHKTMSLPSQNLSSNSPTPIMRNLADLVQTPSFAPLSSSTSQNNSTPLFNGAGSATASSLTASTLNLDNLASRIVGLNLNNFYAGSTNQGGVDLNSNSPTGSTLNLNRDTN